MRSLAPLLAVAVVSLASGALAQQTPTIPSKDYVQAAAQSDQYEILAGETATTETRDPRVRAFAQMMIRDHTRTTQNLMQAATAAGMPPPPPSISGDQSKMLGALQSLRGQEFDRAYAKQQVLAHAQALTVQGIYAQTGPSGPLRQAAQGTVPLIRAHAEAAQQLKAALGGS